MSILIRRSSAAIFSSPPGVFSAACTAIAAIK